MADLPTKSLIRVALRIAGGPAPAYLVAAAEEVMRVAGAEVCLILATDPDLERPSARRRLLDRIDAAYEWCERHALRGGPPALVSRRPPTWPDGVPVVPDRPSAARVDALLAAHADVIIDLTWGIAPDDVPVPPAGRWHLRFAIAVGGARRSRLARPSAAGLVESLLSIAIADGPDVETEVGVGALRRVGYARDRDAVYWRSSLLPARRLARLVAGDGVPSVVAEARIPARGQGPSHQKDTWAWPPFIGLATTVVAKALERILFRTGWSVLVRTRSRDGELPRNLSGFRPIDAPAGRFYADPFVLDGADGPRLYVEDCPEGAHRGRITKLRRTLDGRWAVEGTALDDLEHRAYPHVLQTEAGLLVTPDGGKSLGVDVFIDRGAGVGLERIGRCLEDLAASDPTLLWHAGRYWLFVTVTGHGMSPWDELHLYSADRIDGTWHAHPRNPIVADVRRARPAGRIVRRGDGWVRPGQDCSVAYGRRIVWSAITTLTPDDYKEHPIATTEPEGMPGVRRTHTYSADGSIETVDGYHRVLRRPRLAGTHW